jgi:hypothetical protein
MRDPYPVLPVTLHLQLSSLSRPGEGEGLKTGENGDEAMRELDGAGCPPWFPIPGRRLTIQLGQTAPGPAPDYQNGEFRLGSI